MSFGPTKSVCCSARNIDVICDLPIERQVVEVYGAIGKMLKTYTAGKLPKAFKIIPSLTNWEQVSVKFSKFLARYCR